MEKASAGWRAPVALPLRLLQFGLVADQAPEPPPIWVGLASPSAFQNASGMPAVLIRLICLAADSVWMVWPGTVEVIPPLVVVSAPV